MKKGLIYVFLANIFSLCCSLINGFVLPKFLMVDTYANIKLFQLYVTYCSILSFGFSEGMYLKIGGKNIEELKDSNLYGEFKTFQIFEIMIALGCLLLAIILKNYLYILFSIALFPINMTNYFKLFYQATGKFDRYSRFTIVNSLLMFLTNIILLFFIRDNDLIFIVFYVVIYIIHWLILEKNFCKMFQREKGFINFNSILKNIKEGFSLMLGNFGTALFTTIDRLFVKSLLGIISFAYYSFAVSLENLLNACVAPFSVTLYNYFCKYKEKEKILFLKRIILIFASVIILFAFPAKFIVEHWLTKYTSSIAILFFLFSAQFFSIIVKCIYNNLYKATKKQNRYFKIMLIMIGISILFNIIAYTIDQSIESLAIATLIVNALWLIVVEKEFKIYEYSIKEYFYIFAILICYNICAFCFNTLLGCILYFICILILSYTILKKETKYCLKLIPESFNYLKRKVKR